MQRAVRRSEYFDGKDARTSEIRHELDANPAPLVVHENRASAARTNVAGVLRAGQIKVFAQELHNALLHRGSGDFDLSAVDEEFHLHPSSQAAGSGSALNLIGNVKCR